MSNASPLLAFVERAVPDGRQLGLLEVALEAFDVFYIYLH